MTRMTRILLDRSRILAQRALMSFVNSRSGCSCVPSSFSHHFRSPREPASVQSRIRFIREIVVPEIVVLEIVVSTGRLRDSVYHDPRDRYTHIACVRRNSAAA